MFKIVSIFLIEHLTHITNGCLICFTFPKAWKLASVIPLAKTSNPVDMSQLTSLSIFPMLSKVLENMHKQIRKYIFGNNIILSAQSGFRDCHSTTTALTMIVDDLLRTFDEDKPSYNKALDTMDPILFCDKLKY